MGDGKIGIRMAQVSDAADFLEIYAPYVTDTGITFEYEIPSVDTFKGRIRDTLVRYPYLAAEADGKIVGYAYASSFHERAAYQWAVELSIYMDMDFRGRGIGTLLYRRLETILALQNVQNLNVCISYPNPESIRFHEHQGYQIAGHFHRCGFKLGKWYDSVWMEKHLGSHEMPPRCFIPFSALPEKL